MIDFIRAQESAIIFCVYRGHGAVLYLRMARRDVKFSPDRTFFILAVLLYAAGQLFIGSINPEEGTFDFTAPADIDFLYYAGIIDQMQHSLPPQNPAYGGEPLSQSFVQYYPAVLLSFIVNPYVAMRILNFAYLFLLTAVLRRYFRRGWGAGCVVIAAGSVGFGLINSLGVDLIGRGFNHFPFFIAFAVALFERDNRRLRYVCLFLLGWLHSYSALLALLFFVGDAAAARFSREKIIDAGLCLLGLASAGIMALGVADKPFYFPFVEGFRIEISHLWMHAVPALILAVLARNIRVVILAGFAFLFGLFFHYNPFFPVFMLYFAAGWAVMEIILFRESLKVISYAAAVILLAGFVIGTVEKYNPYEGRFVPISDTAYAGARRWIDENTPADAVLLAVPVQPGYVSRLMEARAVYLGYPPHVAHLGIDWRLRGQNIVTYFRNPPVYMAETDFVVYGPAERKLFPGFRLEKAPVYRDEHVMIWSMGR